MERTPAKGECLIQSGDFIALDMNESGFLSIPSMQEPIPDYNNAVSHLRVLRHQCLRNANPISFPSCNDLTTFKSFDFYRCLFKIVGNMDTPITFGSVVKLTHFPTDLSILATDIVDMNRTKGKTFCVHLKATTNFAIQNHLSYEWIITSKYKLRKDGDPVRSSDMIIIRSALKQELYMDLVSNSGNNLLESFVGLSSVTTSTIFPRIRIFRISDGFIFAHGKGNGNPNDGGTPCSSKVFQFCDHFRLLHVESNGHLISRVNQNCTSKYSRNHVGSIYNAISNKKDDSFGIFSRIRAYSHSVDVASHEDFTSNGVWRIINLNPLPSSSFTGALALKNGDDVRIQHVMSGQYLCMRKITVENSYDGSTSRFVSDPSAYNKKSEYACSGDTDTLVFLDTASSTSSLRAVTIARIVGSGLNVPSEVDICIQLCNQHGAVTSISDTQKSTGTVSWCTDSVGHEIILSIDSTVQTSLLYINVLNINAIHGDNVILRGVAEIPSIPPSQELQIRVTLSDIHGYNGGSLILFLKPLPSLNRQKFRSRSSVSSIVYNDGSDSSEWIVATTTIADQNTIFTLERKDAKDVPYLEYNENLLIYHSVSKALLSVEDVNNTGLTPDSNVWWEDSHDKVVRPIFGGATEDANIFRMEFVSKQDVQEMLYVSRFIPLFRAAVTSFQLTPDRKDLFLPLFRHFRLAMETLCEWTLGRRHADGGLGSPSVPTKETSSTEPISETTAAALSTMNLWLGRPVQYGGTGDDHVRSLNAGVHDTTEEDLLNLSGASDTSAAVSASIMKRQNLLNDANLLVILLHFIDVVYKGSCSEKSKTSNMTATTTLPPIIGRCLRAAYILLEVTVHNNPRLALKVLSLKGVFLSMVSQLIFGWKPPIERILAHTCGSVLDAQELEVLRCAISPQDVHLIVEHMHYLNVHGFFEVAEKILDLVILLGSHTLKTSTASKAVRSTILRNIFSADQLRLVEESPCGLTQERLALLNERDGVNNFCLLFQTYFRDGKWNFRFNANFAFGSCDVTELPRFDEETTALQSMFNYYLIDQPHDGRSVSAVEDACLDDHGSLCLLESLGLSGRLLYEELTFLDGANFSSFARWWNTRYDPIFGPKALTTHQRYGGCSDEQGNYTIHHQSCQYSSQISLRVPGFRIAYYHQHDEHTVPPSSVDSVVERSHPAYTPRLQQDSSGHTDRDLDWLSASGALAHDCGWRSWFRKSLLLLEILSRDRNLFGQLLTSCMLPPDCVLEVFEDKALDYVDKHAWVDLLVRLYVDHDFVYPTRLAQFSSGPSIICGYKEDACDAVNDSDGKLFNELSVFNPTYSSKADYRKRLFQWISDEMLSLNLASESITYVQYASSVLTAFTRLLHIGFFDEKEFGFYSESNHTAVAFGCISISDRGTVSIGSSEENNGHFLPTLEGVEQLLLGKLERSTAAHHRISLSSRRRTSLDSLPAKFQKLDDMCANQSSVVLNSHVLMLLAEVQRLKLIVGTREAFNTVLASVSTGPLLSSMEMENRCDSAYLYRVFMNSVVRDSKAVNAVLTLTAMNDVRIARECYEYIASRINFLDEAALLMRSFSFVPTSGHSKLMRKICAYEVSSVKYMSIILLAPEKVQLFVCEKFQFCLDTVLKELSVFATSMVPPVSLASASSSSSSVSPTHRSSDSVAYRSDDWLLQSSSSTEVLHVLHDESLSVTLNYSNDIPNNEEEVVRLRAYYSNSALESSAVPEIPTFGSSSSPCFGSVDVALSSFCRQLIDSLRRNMRVLDGNDLSWDGLYDSERFVLNIVFSFLSYVARPCALRLGEWCADLDPILVAYFPASDGAVLLVRALLLHLTGDKHLIRGHHHHRRRFVDSVFDKLGDSLRSMVSRALPLSMVLAAMHSGVPGVRTRAAGFFCDSFDDYLCEFSSLSVLPLLCYGHNSKVLRTHPEVHYILEVFAAIVCSADNGGCLTIQNLQSLREMFTLDICRSSLTGKSCPFFVKRVVTVISFHIYRDAELLCDDIVAEELRNMRLYFSMEDSLSIPTPAIEQCVAYISMCVFGILYSRICGSGMIGEATVHRVVVDDFYRVAECMYGGKLPPAMAARLDERLHTDEFPTHGRRRCLSTTGDSVSAADTLTHSAIHNFLTACDTMKRHSWALYRNMSRRDINQVWWLSTSLRIILSDELLHDLIEQKEGAGEFDYQQAIKKIDAVLATIMEIEVQDLFGPSFICEVSSAILLQRSEEVSSRSTRTVSINSLSAGALPTNTDLDADLLESILSLQTLHDHSSLESTGVFASFHEKLSQSMEFIARRGMHLHERAASSELNSREYISQFDCYSDFDIWRKGGGIYFEKLFAYLSQVIDPIQSDYRMVEIICSMLHSELSADSSSSNGLAKGGETASLNRKRLVKKEAARINAIQFALYKLGGMRFLISALGRAIEQRELGTYLWDFVPLVMKFGALLLGWENYQLQDIFIDTVDTYLREGKAPECNCFLGLQRIARKCVVELDSGHGAGNGARNGAVGIRVLRVISVLFDFVGSISRGANSKSQEYLSGKSWNRNQEVRIVEELCLVARSANRAMTKCVQFISSADFAELLCPMVWAPLGSERRRFIAWHNPSNDVVRMTAYAYLVIRINRNLISLCSRHCDASIPIALQSAMPILEIVSSLSLDAHSSVFDGYQAFSLHPRERTIHWHGGEPFLFYNTYVKEMTRLQVFRRDPDQAIILEETSRWRRLLHTTGFQLPLVGMHETANSSNYSAAFQAAFRVRKEFFHRLAKRSEESIVSLALCYFEVTEQKTLAVEVASSFSFAMVLQNTDNAFKKRACSDSTACLYGDDEEDDSVVKRVVQYITLLDALKELQPRYSSCLSTWYHERATSADKDDPRKLFGSIEILDSQGRLRRVFFPVPKFVLTYWSYPEVRLARDALLQNVSRSSPEEKIRSFLVEMNGLIAVMRRQQVLNSLLTPLVHSFLGGKAHSWSTQSLWYLPSLRALTLIIAFGFNICQISQVSISKSGYSHSLAEYWEQSSSRAQILRIIALMEFLLYGLLTCRRIVNSTAGNDVRKSFPVDAGSDSGSSSRSSSRSSSGSSSRVGARLAKVLFLSPAIVFLCLVDAKWLVFLTSCAFYAWRWENYWAYVPCLLDVVFQIKQMYFLYVAITKNIVKIGYTMLLTFLLLYFAAFIAYFYVSDPYSFAGVYSKCSAAENDTILSCYLTHLDYGLNSAPLWPGDGFISPVVPGEYTFPYSNVVSVVAGSVFQLLYVIVINLVLQAIISGLIIDTFFEMRAAADAIYLDTRDKCFVCSITREEFDVAGLDFEVHIKEEHNIWHYVWYRIYLDNRDSTEFTINEKFALACYNDTRMFAKFMPIKRSISLESTDLRKA